MPLLSRYKSNSNSSSSSTNSMASSQQAAPVCQSPLFGPRRQLNLTKQQGSRVNQNQVTSASSSLNQSSQQQELPHHITQQQIHYTFALMDTNGDGMIDLHDLSQMLANLGVPIDESILSYIITSVSRRGDHRISESEFLDWIAQFIQVTSGKDEYAVTPASIKRQLSAERRKLRPKFRLAGGSSGSTLAAKQLETDGPDQLGSSGLLSRGRRGSVGSGLALMRSLSGPSLVGATTSGTGADSKEKQTASTATATTTTTGSNKQSSRLGSSSTSKLNRKESDEEETRNDLKAAFCVFDLDGDGYITFEEVRAGLKLMGESWSPTELRKLFSAAISASSSSSGSASRLARQSTVDRSNEKIDIDNFVKLLL